MRLRSQRIRPPLQSASLEPEHLLGEFVGASRVGLERHVRETCHTVYHPAGTCKMGPDDDEMAVVDPQLRVRGVEGVRVADTSIMPKITSGNTNAPAIAIGERVAELVGRGIPVTA